LDGKTGFVICLGDIVGGIFKSGGTAKRSERASCDFFKSARVGLFDRVLNSDSEEEDPTNLRVSKHLIYRCE